MDTFLDPQDPRAVAEEITDRYDHSFVFGDLNFRLALPSTHALSAPDQLANLAQALSGDDGRSELKEYDQLVIERDVKGTIFHGFREGEFWRFKCSYKYLLGEADKYR